MARVEMDGAHLWGALTLAVALVVAIPDIVEAQGAAQQAAAHHARGAQLFQAGQFQEAIADFQRAQQLAPNRTNVWNIARCLEGLGQYDNAIAHVDAYLRDPGLPPERRQRALQYRQQLLAARSSGRGGGADLSLIGSWVLIGTGAAALLTGAGLYVGAYVTWNESESFATIGEYNDWEDRYGNLALAGDILVAVGAAVAVGGVLWLLLSRRLGRGRSANRTPILTVASTDGGGGVAMTGWF